MLTSSPQMLLAEYRNVLTGPEMRMVGNVLAAADHSGSPLFQAVCFASETELKGRLVGIGNDLMQVATIMTGWAFILITSCDDTATPLYLA